MAKLILSIFDPIEIIVGEQKFVVEKITSKLLAALQSVSDSIVADPSSVRAEQMADILMKAIPGMSKEAAQEVDIRHIPLIVNFLAEQIGASLTPAAGEQKN